VATLPSARGQGLSKAVLNVRPRVTPSPPPPLQALIAAARGRFDVLLLHCAAPFVNFYAALGFQSLVAKSEVVATTGAAVEGGGVSARRVELKDFSEEDYGLLAPVLKTHSEGELEAVRLQFSNRHAFSMARSAQFSPQLVVRPHPLQSGTGASG
jgi:hypothetical protein